MHLPGRGGNDVSGAGLPTAELGRADSMTEDPKTTRRRVRTAQADRLGWAWERDELPDMTAAEAREILRLDDEARAEGQIGNESGFTLDHARLLVAEAAGNG